MLWNIRRGTAWCKKLQSMPSSFFVPAGILPLENSGFNRFKSFLGLCIGDVIPDAKTIWGFKQRLEAEGRKG